MIETSKVTPKKPETHEDDANKKNNTKNVLLVFLNLNIMVLAMCLGGIKKELSGIQESIDFQNLLMLKLMMNAQEDLPADTVLYQDAQRLYVQTRQQGNPQLLKSVAYNK